MAVAISSHENSPMMEMNTTPLIDVMLVLLIMFIITIPPASHVVEMDLPSKPLPQPDPVKNKVVVTADHRILWNGTAVDRSGLRYQLAATTRMQPVPELHLQPEAGARYALVDQVLADTKMAQVSKMGFVGNEQYKLF